MEAGPYGYRIRVNSIIVGADFHVCPTVLAEFSLRRQGK